MTMVDFLAVVATLAIYIGGAGYLLCMYFFSSNPEEWRLWIAGLIILQFAESR